MENILLPILKDYAQMCKICFELIKVYRVLPEYGGNATIPFARIAYEHHGMGYQVELLDRQIRFDFDFNGQGQFAGVMPHLVLQYVKQSSGTESLIALNEPEWLDLFNRLEEKGLLKRIGDERLYEITPIRGVSKV